MASIKNCSLHITLRSIKSELLWLVECCDGRGYNINIYSSFISSRFLFFSLYLFPPIPNYSFIFRPFIPRFCHVYQTPLIHSAIFPRVRFTNTGTESVWIAEIARRLVTGGAENNAPYTTVACRSRRWSQGAAEVNRHLPTSCLNSDYIYMSVSLSVAFTPWIKHFVYFLREVQERTSYTREWFEGRITEIAAISISVLGAWLS
jgi:hypothetical protein